MTLPRRSQAPARHSGESRNPAHAGGVKQNWTPAYAGVTLVVRHDKVPEAWATAWVFAQLAGFAAGPPKNDPGFATVLNPFATTLDEF
jgi:hypothetical protein